MALNAVRKIFYRNHTLKIEAPTSFKKVGITPAGRRLVQTEFANYCDWAQFEQLFPFSPNVVRQRGLFWDSLAIEKLRPLARDADQDLLVILASQSAHSKPKSLGAYLTKYQNFALYEKVRPHVALQLDAKVMVGPSHGDLHDENLMLSDSNELKIIDLDLFSAERNQYFDPINILVSRNILRLKLGWQAALLKVWSEPDSVAAFIKNWPEVTSKDRQIAFLVYLMIRFEAEKQFSNPTKLDDRLGRLLSDS